MKESPLTPAQIVAALETQAQRIETPCGDGTMVWRIWGRPDAPPLVLLHGGSGSWKHWLRNIGHFAATHRVVVPDMPGYGESAMPPMPPTFVSVGKIIGEGLDAVIGAGAVYDIMGFSLGSFMAPWVITASSAKARSLALIHGHMIGRMQFSPQTMLKRWRGVEDHAERDAILRHNLGALMLAHPESADDLTLEVYREDLDVSRLRVPSFIDTLDTSILTRLDLKLFAVTGELDPTSVPDAQAQQGKLKALRPDARTWVIPDAGHWLMWENSNEFHRIADTILNEAATGQVNDGI